jgi:hypothetical protein
VNITGHSLNVRQGSCQAMGSWRNSHSGAEERRTTRQISGGMGMVWFSRGFWGGRLDFWALTKVLRNPLCNVL